MRHPVRANRFSLTGEPHCLRAGTCILHLIWCSTGARLSESTFFVTCNGVEQGPAVYSKDWAAHVFACLLKIMYASFRCLPKAVGSMHLLFDETSELEEGRARRDALLSTESVKRGRRKTMIDSGAQRPTSAYS